MYAYLFHMSVWFWGYPAFIRIKNSHPFTNKAMASGDACPQRALLGIGHLAGIFGGHFQNSLLFGV